MRRNTVRLLLAALCLVSFAGFAPAADIGLSAAASLREAVTELADSFAKKSPGVVFRTNFGGSGTLAKLIGGGAPAGLFISANRESMDYLSEKKVAEGRDIAVLAFSQLGFVGKPGLNVASLQDTVRPERIAVGSPKKAPVGQYALEALKNAGIYGQLEKKLVMAGDVRECTAFVNFLQSPEAKMILSEYGFPVK